MAERSRYQEKIIRRYYDNRESIAVQRLSELVTELYLAEGKKLERHWASVETHLVKLEVPRPEIDHLLKQRKPELLANLVKRLAG